MMQHWKINLALAVLRPNTSFRVDGDNNNEVTWYTEGVIPPTQAEIDAQIAVMDVQRARADSYPNIGDQLDMLWHAIDTGTLDKTSDFYTTLKAVKTANPKPSE